MAQARLFSRVNYPILRMIVALVSFIFFTMAEARSIDWLILLNWSCSFAYSCAEFDAFPPATCWSSSLLAPGVFSLIRLHYMATPFTATRKLPVAPPARTSSKRVATDDSLLMMSEIPTSSRASEKLIPSQGCNSEQHPLTVTSSNDLTSA